MRKAEAEFARLAKGEADAILPRWMPSTSLYEVLTKQAEGYAQIVKAAAGDPDKAVMMLITDKLPGW